MFHRPILRFVTVLLLVWVAFDLAAIDTCALDIGGGQASRQASVAPPDSRGALAHHHAALHPDHCFCHGLSTGADTTAALVDPFFARTSAPRVIRALSPASVDGIIALPLSPPRIRPPPSL